MTDDRVIDAPQDRDIVCTVPPPGWYCTRKPEHEGPCAAFPTETSQPEDEWLVVISDMMDKHVENWPNPKRLATAIKLIDKTIEAIRALPARDTESELARLRAENDGLRTSVVAFGAPFAVKYAKDFGLPSGHLHPTHYDILEAAGARLVAFTRADLNPR